ncbi:inositol 1,4,5-trisphosphate-gated calcium channel ITPR3-like [Littorina saxatilis]|uniref:inositol 1,4,5-trisphosphate-gated calcium channel ITPR3-like n=1 Tax=Littorina saxatilis TaxID=31220 RepID=UPI0038B5C7BD
MEDVTGGLKTRSRRATVTSTVSYRSMTDVMDDTLSIGDIVCLYSEERSGYMYSTQSSKFHNDIAVGLNQDRQRPPLGDQHTIAFEICYANRYKLTSKHSKLRTQSEKQPDNIPLRNSVAHAKIAADTEQEDNDWEQKRNQGKRVLYGTVVQLRHLFTRKYLHVSTKKTSQTESNNMAVELQLENAKNAQFRIMPRYKVKAEGDVVQVDDQIVLESVKSPGQYLHVSQKALGASSVYQHSLELNLSLRQSGFTLYRRHKPSTEDDGMIKVGDPVRFYHKEMEAYLVAQGLFDDELTEDVHLRLRPVDQSQPKTMFPSTSADTYWQIEMEDGPVAGGIVKWEQQCRIIHMCTRRYLAVDKKSRKVTLKTESKDPTTVFRLHAVTRDNDDIPFEAYARVEHVVTGFWLHGLTDDYQTSQDRTGGGDVHSLNGLRYTTAQTRQVTAIQEKQYDDAFTLQFVEPELVENFHYMAGMVPFILKLVCDNMACGFLITAIALYVIFQTMACCFLITAIALYVIFQNMACGDRSVSALGYTATALYVIFQTMACGFLITAIDLYVIFQNMACGFFITAIALYVIFQTMACGFLITAIALYVIFQTMACGFLITAIALYVIFQIMACGFLITAIALYVIFQTMACGFLITAIALYVIFQNMACDFLITAIALYVIFQNMACGFLITAIALYVIFQNMACDFLITAIALYVIFQNMACGFLITAIALYVIFQKMACDFLITAIALYVIFQNMACGFLITAIALYVIFQTMVCGFLITAIALCVIFQTMACGFLITAIALCVIFQTMACGFLITTIALYVIFQTIACGFLITAIALYVIFQTMACCFLITAIALYVIFQNMACGFLITAIALYVIFQNMACGFLITAIALYVIFQNMACGFLITAIALYVIFQNMACDFLITAIALYVIFQNMACGFLITAIALCVIFQIMACGFLITAIALYVIFQTMACSFLITAIALCVIFQTVACGFLITAIALYVIFQTMACGFLITAIALYVIFQTMACGFLITAIALYVIFQTMACGFLITAIDLYVIFQNMACGFLITAIALYVIFQTMACSFLITAIALYVIFQTMACGFLIAAIALYVIFQTLACGFLSTAIALYVIFQNMKKNGVPLTAKSAHSVTASLQEMQDFMIVNSMPSKNRQKLMRNLRIVELLVALLKVSKEEARIPLHVANIYAGAYNVLYTYLKGDSRKNELYIARYIDFFLTQFDIQSGKIGLNAVHMVMELIRDNRKIVDRISHDHIDKFIDLLQKEKNHRYLELLSVLCVCDGVSIADNQNYITETWLKGENQECVYLTDLGDKIGKTENVVYVSTDKGQQWEELRTFTTDKSTEDDEYMFLERQLELFGMLCHGQNEYAIKVITQELDYLTWIEAFTCLRDNSLPDRLRAKYCELTITLFVDISDNVSVMDRVKLSYVYDDIDKMEVSTYYCFRDKVERSTSQTYQYFPDLPHWISGFLGSNGDMTASQIGNNMLVQQVLRLVHCLVRYGFYYKSHDIEQLLKPLMSLLDGRNDKPYPNIAGKEAEETLKHFRTHGRFQPSQETQAIVNAKLQALEVLNLFFNFIFNLRMEKFMNMFKDMMKEANSKTSYFSDLFSSELAVLLREDFSLEDPQSKAASKTSLRKLQGIFEDTEFFREYDIVEILMDLSNYDYDEMVRKSMQLLNRYYSSHRTLFTRAVQAQVREHKCGRPDQVLITDTSVEVSVKLHCVLPRLRRLATAKLTSEQAEELCNILDQLVVMCQLDGDSAEPHVMNQSILYNHAVLEDAMTILTQNIDVKLLEQYGGQRQVFERTFTLLRVMALGNHLVQGRIFERLDMLLSKEGAPAELAECLTEVFTGNSNTCMKVMGHQVQKVMSLVTQHRENIPQFLDLLNAIVKVEELDLPLKRNQSFVMTYFMQYRADIATLIDTPAEKREKVLHQLLTGTDLKEQNYLAGIVDLLATCAEGENSYIESICQTFFSISELLKILNNTSINRNLKRPFLRFLLCVYLNTAAGIMESGAGDLPHDTSKFMEAIAPLISMERQLKNLVTSMTSLITATGAIPLDKMEEFYEKYGAGVGTQEVTNDAMKRYKDNYDAEDDINTKLNIFSVNMQVAYGGVNDVQTQIGYPSDEDYSELGGDEELPIGQEFQEHLKCFINKKSKNAQKRYRMAQKLVKQLAISQSLQGLSEEEKIEQLELDIKCLQLLRGLIHNEIVKLPDGWEGKPTASAKRLRKIEEVQEALDSYDVVVSVLGHLSRSQDSLVMEVLAFLAALLFSGNEDVQNSMLKYFTGTREETFFFAIKNRVQLSAQATREKRELQAMHTAKVEDLIAQAKALRKVMGGNAVMATQLGSMMSMARKSRLSMGRGKRNPRGSGLALNRKSRASGSGPKNKRVMGSVLSVPGGPIHQPHTSIAMGTIDDTPEPAVYISKPRKTSEVSPLPENFAPRVKVDDIDKDEMQELTEAAISMTVNDLEFKDDGYIELVLRIMALMCDNQHEGLQNYLREQPDNIKSVNLVAETCFFLDILYSNVNAKSIPLVIQLFDTLVEFTSGNFRNQDVVFENKLCDYISHLLRVEHFKGCSKEEVYSLKRSIIILIRCLSEENRPGVLEEDTQTIPEMVLEAIDSEVLKETMVKAYKDQKKIHPKKEQLQGLVMEVGFAYYHALCRKTDLDKSHSPKKMWKTDAEKDAAEFFAERTASVEILKDEFLQKVYFHVKDKDVLREELKEKVTYSVDRSTPSNKLRDFMDWSEDIYKDIKYQRRIRNKPLAGFLVQNQWNLNLAVLLLSVVLCLIVLVTWKAPATNDYNPVPELGDWPGAQVTIYVIGCLHNVLSLCVVASFFLSNHLQQDVKDLSKSIRRRIKDSKNTLDGRKPQKSRLHVSFFSMSTLYYMVFFAFSILGTAFYGYFFSFHLLHMIVLNIMLQRVIQAVTRHGMSLIMVGILGLAVLFIFSLLAFAFYRDRLDQDNGQQCSTAYECFAAVVHHGVPEGMYQTFEQTQSFTRTLAIAAYTLMFFIIISLIGLNIISGIIIDTFSELRDAKWRIDEDMKRTCFMCSLESYHFEREPGGFEKHVKREHNQWNYLFFLIHLSETRPNDYSALELYVHRQRQKNSLNFFPLNRAICLGWEENSSDRTLEIIRSQVDLIMAKLRQEESSKEKEKERQRQQEWESRNRPLTAAAQRRQSISQRRPSVHDRRLSVSDGSTSASSRRPSIAEHRPDS